MHTSMHPRRAIAALLVLATAFVGAGTIAQPAGATVTNRLVQVNAAASTVGLATPGDSAVLSFQGVVGQVLSLTGSSGTFATNCDATLTLRNPSGVAIAPATCVGQSGTINALTLSANGIFTATIDATGASVGTLQFQVSSTAAKLSITPNAAELGVVVAAGATVNLGFSAAVDRYVAAYGRDNSDCATTFRIVRPDGVDQFAPICAGGSSGVFVDQSLVTVAGTQKLRIVNTAAATRTVFVQVFSGLNATASTTIDGSTSTFTFLPAQQARVSFPVTTGQSFRVQITDLSAAATPRWCATMLEPDGTNYGTNCNSSIAPDLQLPDTFAPVSGTWTVLLDPQLLFTPTLSLRVVSIADPTALPLDGVRHVFDAVPQRNPLPLHTDLTAGQKVSAHFDATGSTGCSIGVPCTTTIDVIDPSGTPLTGASATVTATSAATLVFTAPTAGTWKFAVRTVVRRTLGVEAHDVSDIVFDQTVTGIAPFAVNAPRLNQDVVVRFVAVAGHTYVANGSDLPFGGTPLGLTVRDPLGAIVGTGTMIDSFSTPHFTTATSGVHELRLTTPLDRRSPSYTGAITDVTTLDVPVSLGAASPLLTTRFDQGVTFRFTGSTGQKISTKALVIGGLSSFDVAFVRPNGTQLGVVRPLSGATTFLDPLRLDASGTWSVRFVQTGGVFAGGNVQVRFANVPDVTGSLTVDRTILPFAITTPGQIAKFTFTRSAGQTFRVHFAGSSFTGAVVSVTPPLGVPTALCTLTASTLDCPLRTAPLLGTYTVVVNPPLERLGSAAIAITTS